MTPQGSAQVVTRQEVEQALDQVEARLGPDRANLLRAYLRMLESQLRVYRLGHDDEQEEEHA